MAVFADAIDFVLVRDHAKAQFFCRGELQLFDLLVVKLENRIALDADHVVVVLVGALVAELVATGSVAEVALFGDAARSRKSIAGRAAEACSEVVVMNVITRVRGPVPGPVPV